MTTWATQVAAGGLLAIEEVEAIDTTHPAFESYLGIVEAMLRSQYTELYVGRVLDKLVDPPSLCRQESRARRLRVSDRDAATMFSMNVPNWKENPFIRDTFGTDAIRELEAELNEIAGGTGEESQIAWTLRQMVFERAA